MNWMTVKEVAKYLKLSDMMIYKLAQQGRIPAAKIGSAWRFAQTEIDAWMLKQTKKPAPFPPMIAEIIHDMHEDLIREFGDNFALLMVYGSYARGDARTDSDLDLMIVFKKIPNYWKVKSTVMNMAYHHSFGKDRPIVVTTIVMEEKEFRTSASPLLLNVREEGRQAA